MASYENRIIAALRNKKKQPLSLTELCKKTGVNRGKKTLLTSVLDDMKAQNVVLEMAGKYYLIEHLGLTPGEVVKVTSSFGFVRPQTGDRDIFIPGKRLMGGMPGDEVLMRLHHRNGEHVEGEIMEITKTAERIFSGVVVEGEDEQWMIRPDNYVKFDLRIHRDLRGGAEAGEKVVAKIERRAEDHTRHLVRILERFGDSQSASACCKAILAANDIHAEFPTEVLEQAESVAAGEIYPKELEARTDLRGEVIFTIDGADAKDLDDAISLKKVDDGWELGVHIADVSYYVPFQSPLDNEAFVRGTSVYYADSVVPMLPKELSNGICSLNPNEDRLAFSALMKLDKDGALVDYRFKKTVIRSRVKGIYTEVNAILDGSADKTIREKYGEFADMIERMAELAAILTKRRYGRGGLNLESTEGKIIIGGDGKAYDVMPRTRGTSEMVIEEFMLTANEAAARLAREQAMPFVYRTHDNPSPDRIASLYDMLDRLGIKARRPKGNVTSAQLTEVLCLAEVSHASSVVNALVLRAMAKAKYMAQPLGHFGLALKDYTHFTSPIRRYPDLTIHRVLSGYVTGMKPETIKKKYGEFVSQSASRSTEREIAAMTAERSCEDCYKAEYMQRFIGEEFDGVVTGAAAFGLYVQLPNTVEGLIPLSHLPLGDWEFDGAVSLTDSVTGRKFQLGDAVRVKVLAARISAGQVDFGFVDSKD